MAKTYDLAGQYFTTQKALEATVKEIIRSLQMDTVFRNDLLREIVNTLHPEVMQSGQQSDGRFEYLSWREQVRRKLPYAEMYRGGPVMTSFFVPLGDWRDVTVYPWRKNIYEPRTQLVAALRVKAAPMQPRPTLSDKCAYPGCRANGYALHYHHLAPTFAEMVDECMALISNKEQSTLFGYSKFAPGILEVSDCIPDNHPAIARLKKLHESNSWIWLCHQHHDQAHNGGVAWLI